MSMTRVPFIGSLVALALAGAALQPALADVPQSGDVPQSSQSADSAQSAPLIDEGGAGAPAPDGEPEPDVEASPAPAPAPEASSTTGQDAPASEPARTTVPAPRAELSSHVTGCDFADPGMGAMASQLCWIDMGAEGAASGAALVGHHEVSISEIYTVSFDVTSNVSVTKAFAFPTWGNADGSGSGSFLGRGTQYVGVGGNPAVYMTGSSTTKPLITFSNIRAFKNGVEIPGGYSMIVADAESTDNGEYMTFTTTGNAFAALPNDPAKPNAPHGNACAAGTTVSPDGKTVTCTAGSSQPSPKTGTMMLETEAPVDDTGTAIPWTVTAELGAAGGKQGVAFALRLRGVEIYPETDAEGAVEGDEFRPVILRQDADGVTVVRDKAGSNQFSEISSDASVTYYVGTRVVPSAASRTGGAGRITDYARRWVSPDGTDTDACTTQANGGSSVPVEEFAASDLGEIRTLDGEVWPHAADTAVVKVGVTDGDVVSCRLIAEPSTLTVTNRVVGIAPGDAHYLDASSWTPATTSSGPLSLPAGASVATSAATPVAAGSDALTLSNAAADAARYARSPWTFAAAGHQTGLTTEPSGALTLPEYPIGSGITAPLALTATVTHTFASGTLTWQVTDPSWAVRPLTGSVWRLVDYDPATGREGIATDLLIDDDSMSADGFGNTTFTHAPVTDGHYRLYLMDAPSVFLVDPTEAFDFPAEITAANATSHQEILLTRTDAMPISIDRAGSLTGEYAGTTYAWYPDAGGRPAGDAAIPILAAGTDGHVEFLQPWNRAGDIVWLRELTTAEGTRPLKDPVAFRVVRSSATTVGLEAVDAAAHPEVVLDGQHRIVITTAPPVELPQVTLPVAGGDGFPWHVTTLGCLIGAGALAAIALANRRRSA